jgi:protein TonB
MTLRTVSTFLSLAAHGGLIAFFLVSPGGASLEEGSGDDMFVVEQGIAIEGIAKLGNDQTTVDAVEAPEISEARPLIEEVKPVEKEEQQIITSESGPEQEKVFEPEPKEVQEQRPPQIATLEQKEIAVEEQRASGDTQAGGTASIVSAYRGKLFDHLSRKKVNPRSRQTGTVVVRFTVDSSGQLLSREIAVSSGSQKLDDAAVASVDRAAPFPPMPSEIASGPMALSVPFKFSVR